MRSLVLVLPLVLAVIWAGDPPPAAAKPEFARREGRACGYCHINPRGGGARNQRGLAYARNEFKFPSRKGDLTVFVRERDRKAMIHAQTMIHLDHVRVAFAELKRIAKAAKGTPAKQAARDALHALDVKGSEILGHARLMLRGREAKERNEAVELLVVLVSEYKGLDVYAQALSDLKELKRQPEYRQLIASERWEAKARLLYLDATRYEAEKREAKANKAFGKVLKAYPQSRAAQTILKRDLPEQPQKG